MPAQDIRNDILTITVMEGHYGKIALKNHRIGYPLIRSRSKNLYGQIAYDAKTFKDYVDAFDTVADKQSKLVIASLYGDFRDALDFHSSGAQTNYSLSLPWACLIFNRQSCVLLMRSLRSKTAISTRSISTGNFH